MFVFLAWVLFVGHDVVSITINGRQISSPFETVIGVWGFILTLVILFCVAILLAFVLVGVGLIVLGVLALVGLILAAILFPFLLPLLIPLFIIWVFCSLACRLFFK
jgi:predicted exporter